MSAVRRTDRRANRNRYSSPYARPTKSSGELQDKKPHWSISGLLRFLNPFAGSRKTDESDQDDSDDSEDDLPRSDTTPVRPGRLVQPEGGPPEWHFSPTPPPDEAQLPAVPQNVPAVTAPAPNTYQAPHSPPPQLPFPLVPAQSQTTSSSSQTSSLVRNLEPVTRFLVEKAGQPLNEFEAAGIVDYIQKNVQVADKPEPFRFSTSPSRGSSPSLGNGSSNISDVPSVQTPRKTLSRNPNGVYRWQGAGSSRPRTRYQSPGFGSRSQPSRIKLSPPKTPLVTDTKRRRVIDEAESSLQRTSAPSTSTVRFPSSSVESRVQSTQPDSRSSTSLPNGKASTVPTPAAPVTPRANGVPSSRLRTTGLIVKPTAPAVPSPLRQAWKESDSPPQPSPPSRPTRAAGFMAELIKEVTPTKKVDVSNPYQTASPVKPPPRKPAPKRPRSSVKPTEKLMEKEKEREVTAQEIIEATVPKGSKRSRPPPEMENVTHNDVKEEKQPTPTANGSQPPRFRPSVNLDVVEKVADDEEGSPSKKRKTTAPSPKAAVQADEVVEVDVSKEAPSSKFTRPAEIIEPGDDSSASSGKLSPAMLSPPAAGSKPLLGMKSSVPKEPSKLRYSYQADKVELVSTESAAPPMPAPAPIPSLFAPAPATAVPAKAKLAPKDEVLAMDVDELPKYDFFVETSYPAGASFVHARETVITMTVSSLPTFDFKPIPVRALNGFNWTAAGMKAPALNDQKWRCKTCDLENPASATEKCTICEAPRPASTSAAPAPTPASPPGVPVPPAPPKVFDWSAAGLARPAKPRGDSWTCSLCGLSNPSSATAKCTICDAPR